MLTQYSIIFSTLATLFLLQSVYSISQLITHQITQKLSIAADNSPFEIIQIADENKIFIFGFINNTKADLTLSDKHSFLVQIVLSDNGQTLSIYRQQYFDNNQGPQYDSSHCSVYDKQFSNLYIYSGGQNQTILWKFNIINRNWQKISQIGPQTSHCSLQIQNRYLYLLGLRNQNSALVINYININSGDIQWNQLDFSFVYGFQEEVKLWDETIGTTITNINFYKSDQNHSTKISSNTISIITQNFCTISSDNTIMIVSSKKIYKLNLTSNIIQFKGINNWYGSKDSNFNCKLVENQGTKWIFVSDFKAEKIRFYEYEDPQIFGSLIMTNIQVSEKSSQMFYLNDNIYLIAENYHIHLLQKDCNNLFNEIFLLQMFSVNISVQYCFFDKLICSGNFRGQYCQQLQCPNTLHLIDQISFTEIIVQCSNHGLCLNQKCVCEQYWKGDDCSIYSRKQCFGEVIDNWPVINCECLEDIRGGNSCETVFCYNDCTNHGICQNNGQCKCESGYFGEDCSIVIIDFPGVTSIS